MDSHRLLPTFLSFFLLSPKPRVSCIIKGTGQECQQYLNQNQFPNSLCLNGSNQDQYNIPVKFVWDLCNTSQKKPIALQGVMVETRLRQQDMESNGGWGRKANLTKKSCKEIRIEESTVNHCTQRQTVVAMTVEKNGIVCKTDKFIYKMKLEAECLDNIQVG